MNIKERNREIMRLYKQRKKSLTLEQIGQRFGITKQRVVQIIRDARSRHQKKVIKN